MEEQFDIYKSIRKDWGELNPVTRIKKRKKKPKRVNNSEILKEYYADPENDIDDN